MYVVAGPAGSGKSTAFPGDGFGSDYFNADNYAAMLNGGSYVGIPKSIRAEVGPICERFIQDHIAARKSFATETTLRSPLELERRLRVIVFDQIEQASQAGFAVRFNYGCVEDAGISIRRIIQRAYQGGHSGSEDTILGIRSKSLANFPRILDELGRTVRLFDVFDNSALDAQPRIIATFQAREIIYLDAQIPAWLNEALEQTSYTTQSLLACFERKQPLPDAPSPD